MAKNLYSPLSVLAGDRRFGKISFTATLVWVPALVKAMSDGANAASEEASKFSQVNGINFIAFNQGVRSYFMRSV